MVDATELFNGFLTNIDECIVLRNILVSVVADGLNLIFVLLLKHKITRKSYLITHFVFLELIHKFSNRLFFNSSQAHIT